MAGAASAPPRRPNSRPCGPRPRQRGGFAAAAAQARGIAADRQALYADPVVRRIFEELPGTPG